MSCPYKEKVDSPIRQAQGRPFPRQGKQEWLSHPAKDGRMMKLVSVNTGLPREVSWHGRRMRV
jgi:hypothetical protein